MLSSLRSIIQNTTEVNILHCYGKPEVRDYNNIVWMGTFSGFFQDNSIYIGELSQFPDDPPPQGIGMIVINDSDRDCSAFECEIVVLAPETDLAELCLLLKDKVVPGNDMPEIARILLSGLFNNCGINEIIDAAHAHLKNPIMVTFSHNHKNIYYSCDKKLQYEFDVPESVIRERESAIGYAKMRKSIMNELHMLKPVIIEDGDFFPSKRRVLSAIKQGVASQQILGVIAVFEVNRDINDRDITLIEIISRLISEKCGSPVFREGLLHPSYDQHLQDLLQGKAIGEDLAWMGALFGPKPYDFSLAMIDVRAKDMYALEALRFSLSRTIRAQISITRGSYLIAIANLANRDIPDYRQLLRDFAKSDHIVIGCSCRFRDIRQLRLYYLQAKMVLRYAARFNLSGQLCEFSNIKSAVLINELSERMDLNTFVCDDLERLIDFDRENNTEYYQTLMAWLHNGMSREVVQEKLHIHRNTLLYRLKRIEEILGMNLHEENNLLNLYLSEMIFSHLTSGL